MHWGRIVILFLLSVECISAEVYDVTTIYKTIGSVTPIAELNKNDNYNLVCDDTCLWETNGWRRYETMSDKSNAELYKSNGKLIFPLPSQKFGISISRHDDEERIFIYLLPEDDVNALYMTIIVLTHSSGRKAYSEVFFCTDEENTDTLSYHAVELPNGNSRQCQTVLERKVIPYLHNYNIYFTLHNVIKIYIQSEDGTNLEVLYTTAPGDLAFIALDSTRETSFSVKPTSRVTRLSKLTGTLKSPNLFKRGLSKGYATCLTISYYIKTASNVSLNVYVEKNNWMANRMIEIGAVNVKHQPEGISKIHQFIWYATDAWDYGFQYKIKAARNSDDIVLIRKISGCHNAGFANVTTVQKKGSVEVQARNNAVGLPLQSSENAVPSLNINNIYDESFVGNTSQWNSVSWIRRYDENVPLLLSDISRESSEQLAYEDSITPIIDFTGYLEIKYNPSGYYQNYYLDIILLDDTGDIESSKMYKIRLANSNDYYKYVYKCISSPWYGYVSQEENIQVAGYSRTCQNLWQESYGFNILENKNIILKLTQSSLRITGISQMISVDLGESSDITKVCLESSRTGYFTIIQGSSTWLLPSDEGTLRSPSLVTDSDNVCVSVTYYMDDNCELQLRLETLHQNILDVANLSTRNKWTTEVKNLKLPEQYKQTKIQIVIYGKKNYGSKMLIQHIAGCKHIAEEKVDIIVLSNGDKLEITENVYNVAIRQNPQTVESRQCMNGGIFDSVYQGCVCPAGFGGSSCEISCGINAFGANCDGICSVTLKGCKEMIFCRDKLGCNCATGLQGALCSSTCEPGYYGAGCRQQCGNCNYDVSACNIYTGYCSSGCLEGYYPPFCKEYYKHFTKAPEVVSINSDNITVTVNLANTTGKGKPTFFQLQYSESDDLSPVWFEVEPILIPECKEVECVFTEHIRGLKQGTEYKIRAVLLDEDGSSYQGENIPQQNVTTTTNCIVPKKIDYKLRADHITENSFIVFWEYTPESNWCTLKTFEVEFKESSGWMTYYQGIEEHAVFTDMWYGWEHKIKIRAITVAGAAAYSDILVVKTKEEAPHEVRDIKVTSLGSKTLALEWTPPLFTGGLIKHYVISYKCMKRLACREEYCSYFSGEVKSPSTSVTIGNLIPFAQYSISVAAYAATLGPAKHILAATTIAEPQVSPSSSLNPVPTRTNTSITVQWKPPQNCSRINGFLHGYLYELVENRVAEQPASVLSDVTSVTFSNLKPLTNYTVKIFVINSAGWNSLYPLVITASTRATTPDMVRNLIVYKQGRRMIGFRWNAPKQLYGELQSFTVSYQMNTAGSRPLTSVVEPTPCPAWPELYCHTFTRLQPDTEYTITVSARNNEVNEDGDPVNVTAFTKERAPAEPSYLKAVAINETSITLEWGLPDMINGLLRSFLLSVEGTDSHDPNECCQNLPLQEIAVQMEEASYQFQVSGLRPSSTYSVSVSGKTVSLGSAVSISAHTRPSLPVLEGIIKLGSEPVPQNMPVIIQPVKENKDLISAYLLIVIPENAVEVPTSMIMDEWLREAITEELDTHYIAGEYTQEDLEENPEVFIGTGSGMHVRKLSTTQDPELQNGTDYSLAVAVVLDYCGVKNVGISTTPTFRINI